MVGGGDRPTVLVVEDDRALVELYVRWLEADYQVRTATDGETALADLDDDVDVVLLDRLMPGMSGDEVLSKVRDRVDDCRVAMVSGVEPDFDVLTLGFDDYLTKPVEREKLVGTVERLLARSDFAALERELYALVAKQAALRAAKPGEALEESEEFAELETRIAELRSELDAALPGMESDEFVAMVQGIESDETGSDGGDPDGDGGDPDGDGGDPNVTRGDSEEEGGAG